MPSFGNGGVEDLSAEESALGALYHLLIHGLRWMIHQHSAVFVINLRIHAGVADQVDDPLLSVVL